MDEIRPQASSESGEISFEKRQIIRSLSSFEDFPALNPRTARIIAMLREKFVNLPKLAMVMERNKTFRDHFVKLSGVPEMGEDTVKEAMRAMGLLNTKHLICSFLIMPLYTHNDQEEWEHVYTTSILICNMLKHYRMPESSSLPLTALLHDIGIPLLRRFTPHRYDQIKRYARDSKQLLEEVEEANLNISHAVAGGICVRKWALSDDIFIPVSYHHSHEPLDEPDDILRETYLLQYADWLDHHARNLSCQRPDNRDLMRFGYQESDETYWLDYQRLLVSSISFANFNTASDVDAFSLRSSFNDSVGQLVAPLGYVEKLRREAAQQQFEEEQRQLAAEKNSVMDLGRIIKEKLLRKKEQAAAGIKPSATQTDIAIVPPTNTYTAETQTQVFSRPKSDKPSFSFEENKPLRLRSNGKVLETATRVFKRPTINNEGKD